MPELIDITARLHAALPTWPRSTGFELTQTRSFAAGDGVNVSRIAMDVHFGTHVEGPSHYIDGGAALEAIPLETFLGPATVIALGDAGAVGPDEFAAAGIPAAAERLLIRTRNSDERLFERSGFAEHYVALTVAGARWIADRGIRLVGIDYLSVQLFGGDDETHRTLMRAGVAILEGLDLSDVEPGPYRLTCLPMRLAGAEAAPARAVLERLP